MKQYHCIDNGFCPFVYDVFSFCPYIRSEHDYFLSEEEPVIKFSEVNLEELLD